jgi:hypothetical protein
VIDDGAEDGRPGRFDYAHLNFRGIERRLAAGEYVAPIELAKAIRSNGSHPISPQILDYLCRILEEKVTPPKGRKPRPEIELRLLRMVIRERYRHYLQVFTRLKRRRGGVLNCNGERRTPAEAAARLVALRYWHGEASWRQIQNIASSAK